MTQKKRHKRDHTALIVCITVICTLLFTGVGTFLYENYQNSLKGDASDAEPAIYTQSDMDEALAIAESRHQNDMEEAVGLARIEGAAQQLAAIRATLLEGKNALEMLKPLYPGEIVVVSGGRYHFVPINYDLKQAPYTLDNLEVLESGEVRYLDENGNVISHKGIDVSKFQGNINWQKVKNDGVEFAIIRIGLRGYGSGEINDDKYATANLKGAHKAGIHTGVYFFTQAVTVEEAIEEAEYTLDLISDYNVDCPVVIDVEKVSSETGRMNLIDVETRTDAVIAFCERIKEAGYTPMIYNNTEMGAMLLDLTRLEDYPKWFAGYRNEFYYPYHYDVWQYTDTGSVSGITGNVDLNISFAPLWEE